MIGIFLTIIQGFEASCRYLHEYLWISRPSTITTIRTTSFYRMLAREDHCDCQMLKFICS